MEKCSVFVAGAGGIGSAVCLLLREASDYQVDLFLGDMNKVKADAAKAWLLDDRHTKVGKVEVIEMPSSGTSPELEKAVGNCEVILDCLPGCQAPRMAQLALRNDCHYANLTEYVEETKQIERVVGGLREGRDAAKETGRGFILQTGLAPGFINVLALSLFNTFCDEFGVDKVDNISMKVGALSKHAFPPHYYGFTWSTVGVATEYIRPAIVLRNFEETLIPSLSERATVVISGMTYEEAITSGGAADLPQALSGKVKNLDYKTLRHTGHYQWVDEGLRALPADKDKTTALEAKMVDVIPEVEGDFVLIYASVQGRDNSGRLRVKERSYNVEGVQFAGKTLKAIQATTAASLAECTRMLLSGTYRGVVHQSEIEPEQFLNGPFIKLVYRG